MFLDGGAVWWVVGYADFDLHLPDAVYLKREPIKPFHSAGVQIRQDGQYWMIWKPSEDRNVMMGYCGDSGTWRYGTAQRYPSKQACEEIINNLNEEQDESTY